MIWEGIELLNLSGRVWNLTPELCASATVEEFSVDNYGTDQRLKRPQNHFQLTVIFVEIYNAKLQSDITSSILSLGTYE